MTDIVFLFQLYLSICQQMGWIHYGETSRPARLHVLVACLVFWTCAANAGVYVALRWLSASSGSSFAGRAQRVLAEGSPPARPGVEIRGLQIKRRVKAGGEAVKKQEILVVVFSREEEEEMGGKLVSVWLPLLEV